MSGVYVRGLGAVSSAGWGVAPLRQALGIGTPLPCAPLSRPGQERLLRVRPVPPPNPRPAFLGHARVRRSAAITHYLLGAAIEALDLPGAAWRQESERLGLIVCVMSGCITYLRRFFEEILENPSTASPLLFPETVFNASASHLAALLGSTAETMTLVGDEGVFLQGLATASHWLMDGKIDTCLVVGAEETDWLIADAMRLFNRQRVHAAGAGALCLGREPAKASAAQLTGITSEYRFSTRQSRRAAAIRMRAELPPTGLRDLLVLGTQGLPSDMDELEAWHDWRGLRLEPRTILGDAFPASTAWHCVAACDALERGVVDGAVVSAVGANQQAIGACFAPSGGVDKPPCRHAGPSGSKSLRS